VRRANQSTRSTYSIFPAYEDIFGLQRECPSLRPGVVNEALLTCRHADGWILTGPLALRQGLTASPRSASASTSARLASVTEMVKGEIRTRAGIPERWRSLARGREGRLISSARPAR